MYCPATASVLINEPVGQTLVDQFGDFSLERASPRSARSRSSGRVRLPGCGEFTQVGADARALSIYLTLNRAALRTNVADTAAVAADLRTLATQLDELEASLGTADGGGLGSATAALNAARIVLVGLLAWLAVPAVICTWLGWARPHAQRTPLLTPRGPRIPIASARSTRG